MIDNKVKNTDLFILLRIFKCVQKLIHCLFGLGLKLRINHVSVYRVEKVDWNSLSNIFFLKFLQRYLSSKCQFAFRWCQECGFIHSRMNQKLLQRGLRLSDYKKIKTLCLLWCIFCYYFCLKAFQRFFPHGSLIWSNLVIPGEKKNIMNVLSDLIKNISEIENTFSCRENTISYS